MSDDSTRREFLQRGLTTAGTLAAARWLPAAARSEAETMKKFDISLAAWSVHRRFYAGQIKQIDMPELCRKELDLEGLELVNSFFPSPQYAYCQQLRKRARDHGVKILLIMCDGEGDLGAADATERRQAVRNHRKWIDIAAVLGCHSIRVNSGGTPGEGDSIQRCAESCIELVTYARADRLNILIENHGGVSTDPDALVAIAKHVNDPCFGMLPDFGNWPASVDRYEAIAKLMPFAKAVSAKCHEFDEQGNEKRTNFARMMKVVLDAGYRGYVGIEYEGPDEDELRGVRACKKLLERFQ